MSGCYIPADRLERLVAVCRVEVRRAKQAAYDWYIDAHLNRLKRSWWRKLWRIGLPSRDEVAQSLRQRGHSFPSTFDIVDCDFLAVENALTELSIMANVANGRDVYVTSSEITLLTPYTPPDWDKGRT